MKIDDFDYNLTEEYHEYCMHYFKFCNYEDELKKTEKGSEKYKELLEGAQKRYHELLQWYNLLITNASTGVMDVKNRLMNLGEVTDENSQEQQIGEKPDDDTVNMCLYVPDLECPYVKRGHLDEVVCAIKGHEKEMCGYDSSFPCAMKVCTECEHYPADRLARLRNRREDGNWCWLDQRIRCFRCRMMSCKDCKHFPKK